MTTAAERIRHWRENPLAFVREVFGTEPDLWQQDVLRAFPSSMRLAMKACKGPGKTCVLAWIAWNFLLTRPHPKVIATSITADNLADGLWAEMAKWQHKSRLLRETFTWRKESIASNEFPETWFMAARTWPRTANPAQQADTLAGKHADYMLFLLDEAGGIPDAVMAAAEAGLANARVGNGKEAHIVIAGNPTHLEGPLYKACSTEAGLWHVTEITSDPESPKRSPRVSKQWALEQIQKYGRDNPWVLVNVFGQFPPSSLNSLLGPDDVRTAMDRKLQPADYEAATKILGVDVAREGDDCSVIVLRQGIRATVLRVLRNVNSIQGAGAVAQLWNEHQVDACFIDNTGGFGGGWLDQLRQLGRYAIGVHFAGTPRDMRYVNKRAEMYFECATWIKEGAQLWQFPPEIVGELTTPTYFFKGDKFQIEEKQQIKERLQRSPDIADALALTFADPVFKQHPFDVEAHRSKPKPYDMFFDA